MSLLDALRDSVFWTIGTRDLIDIGILWYMLYRALLLLRGTRAIQSLVGLLLLGALYAVSQRFELYAIRWTLDKFFVYIVLAVLILFQDDIRRGLARTGGRLFPTLTGNPDSFAHEELVQAAFAMASRRIGALIVIERQASLSELVESGHPIDGQVTQDLLLSIFHPTSPLHDGAVIIRKGRVASAKVFLPLSLSKDIARYFGTRHRAAFGLAEEADAAIVVVSEERGAVSLVLNGALTPIEDTNELRQRLQEIFQSEEEKERAEGRAA
ncbi:MAG: TIGR00159 family protein [Alphaproteobacteria bacterium]|nr:TIGR00159 family protein [Alphaproteobacteria bacterium]